MIDPPIIASLDQTSNCQLPPLLPLLLRLPQHLRLLLRVVVRAFRAVQCLLHLLPAALPLQALLPHLVVQHLPQIAVMVCLTRPRHPNSQLMSGTKLILWSLFTAKIKKFTQREKKSIGRRGCLTCTNSTHSKTIWTNLLMPPPTKMGSIMLSFKGLLWSLADQSKIL